MYKYGDRVYLKMSADWTGYKTHIEELEIVQVDSNMVCLIGKDGNRWKNPIKVKDSRAITPKEMNKLIGKPYTRERFELVSKEEYDTYWYANICE